jgi:hypothetical protein
MNNQFNDIERYGDDLNDMARMDESIFETQLHGINRVWFLPIILFGGLVTTAIVFIAIYVINIYSGYNVLAWLFYYIIPGGAILGGLLAGIGYAIAAYYVQFCPKMRFIFFVFLLQFALFFVARYMEYSVYCYHTRLKMQQEFEQHFPPIIDEKGNVIAFDRNIVADAIKKSMPSFFVFYRARIEESEWVDQDDKDRPFKMGKWGWAIEFFTAFVFAICSLLSSIILTALPYCQTCQHFMSEKLVFLFPMRAPKRKIKKNDEAGLEAFHQEEIEAIKYATEKIAKIEDFLKTEHATNRSEIFRLLCEIRDEITADAKPTVGVPNAIKIIYSECNSCNNFLLNIFVIPLDVNNKTAFKTAEIMRFTDGKFVAENVTPTPTI